MAGVGGRQLELALHIYSHHVRISSDRVQTLVKEPSRVPTYLEFPHIPCPNTIPWREKKKKRQMARIALYEPRAFV